MKVRKPEPAEIEFKNMRFLITYRPTDATMDKFIEVGYYYSMLEHCSTLINNYNMNGCAVIGR